MIIVHIINSLNKGGAEQVLKNLIISDNENEHLIYTLIDNGDLKNELKNKVKSIKNINPLLFLTNPFYFYKIINEIKNKKPDIIQSWMYHSNFISIFFKLFIKTKIIWNIRHGNIFKSQSKNFTKVIVVLCGFFSYFIPVKIIYCSDFSMKNHLKIFYDKKKSKIIHNGIDPKKFYKSNNIRIKVRKKLKIHDSSFIIGMIANWRKQKNHSLLFQSLKQINAEYKLILIGKGISLNNQNLIEELKKAGIYNKTKILDYFDDINEIYNLIDLTILTSFDESFPNVIAESMMSSTLCVSTNVGEVNEIINKYGWIINSFDKDIFCIKLKKIFKNFKNKKKWEENEKKAFNHINKNFNINIMVQNYVKFWKSYS